MLKQPVSQPLAERSVAELTVRGIILGGLITLVFTAANVYLGLKAGITFATSIPAAVISMGILHKFSHHSIQENNIVQTIASAAGTLSAIIFVLPALIMVGYWQGFPYWTTVAVCAIGGILGVMFSIPLRRALVTGSDLRYPEGVAAAEVLKVGDTTHGSAENRQGMAAILWGGLASAGFMLLTYLKAAAATLSTVFRVSAGGTMVGASLSLALMGVGHLVGLGVGIAMLVGLALAYGAFLPYFSASHIGTGPLADVVSASFQNDVRLIGAGAMAVAAIWTLLKIIGPIARGMKDAAASQAARKAGHTVDITERDIPMNIVALVIAICLIPIAFLLWDFLHGTLLEGHMLGILIAAILFVGIIGIVVASVCGYMAGLIGSSNSPISGVGILVVIISAVLIRLVHGPATPHQATVLIAFTLFTAALVFGIATISNDNLQDLKTGQLVGATPWKQQIALIIGVVFGSAIIPPILELMQRAFGFQGAPGAGENALAAPQAAIMSTLAKGIFSSELNWARIGLGALIGIFVIIIDEVLTHTTSRLSLPPLAVGMGLYLPQVTTLTIVIGAVIGALYDRWVNSTGEHVETRHRLGVLLSTGLIVGESLFGVIYAGIVAATGKDEPLALLPEGFSSWSQGIGAVLFILIIVGLYRYIGRLGARTFADIDSE